MKTVLCLDEDKDILDTYEIILDEEGYNVICSDDSSNILELVEKYSPSLIFLDINMGESNGLEICKYLRSYINTPIIMVSPNSSVETVISNYGATDLLFKPIKLEELVDTVDCYLSAQIIPLFSNRKSYY